MTGTGALPSEDITLCLVVSTRHGNLANVLHSVDHLAAHIVVIDAGSSGKSVAHLASEYDARYIQVPADPDESALLNMALDYVQSPWALFLHQQEVLHNDDPGALLSQLRSDAVLAYELPVVHFHEPSNHHFQTRLIRTGVGLRWHHRIHPTVDKSLDAAVKSRQLQRQPQILTTSAIVTLGEPEWEEWELRDAIIRLERELDDDASQVRYWFHLADLALRLEEWDRAHVAVEEGLSVISRASGIALEEPHAVNGLIGMFCATMLRSEYYPENTVESLLTIFLNMPGDGRLAVPLGRLLQAVGRGEDAVKAQRVAIENFFHQRRYHLSLEEGLFKPIMFEWEMRRNKTGDALLNSVVEIQTLLVRHHYKLQLILEFVYESHQSLFFEIQTILQRSLQRPD